jgi:hypothetical protein
MSTNENVSINDIYIFANEADHNMSAIYYDSSTELNYMVILLEDLEWRICQKTGLFNHPAVMSSRDNFTVTESGNSISVSNGMRTHIISTTQPEKMRSAQAAAMLNDSVIHSMQHRYVGGGNGETQPTAHRIENWSLPHLLFHSFGGVEHFKDVITPDSLMSADTWIDNHLEPLRQTFGAVAPAAYRNLVSQAHVYFDMLVGQKSGRGGYTFVKEVTINGSDSWPTRTVVNGVDGLTITTQRSNNNTGSGFKLMVRAELNDTRYNAVSMTTSTTGAGFEEDGDINVSAWATPVGDLASYVYSTRNSAVKGEVIFYPKTDSSLPPIVVEGLVVPLGNAKYRIYIKLS